jgi:hypothetical protein
MHSATFIINHAAAKIYVSIYLEESRHNTIILFIPEPLLNINLPRVTHLYSIFCFIKAIKINYTVGQDS